MPTWTITDVDRGIYLEQLDLGAEELNAAGCRVRKRTLRGGLSDGVDVVEVDTGAFHFTVLPSRGMGLHKAHAGEARLEWQSPVRGPVHPKFVNIWEPNGIGWLSGFDELLVRCGLESNGAPEFDERGILRWPLHGRIANLPAHLLEVTAEDGQLRVMGEVDEARLFCNKLRLRTTYSAAPGEAGVTVADEITNIGNDQADLELLYHINVGAPFLSPGAQVLAPFEKLVPRTPAAAAGLDQWQHYGQPQKSAPEQVYFTELATREDGSTEILLKGASGNSGLSLHFNRGELPYFVVWKNPQLAADGYVTGLEPTLNFPNPKSFEDRHGRVRKLAPGETFRSHIRLAVHNTAAGVQAAEQAIGELSAGVTPEIVREPGGDWVAE